MEAEGIDSITGDQIMAVGEHRKPGRVTTTGFLG